MRPTSPPSCESSRPTSAAWTRTLWQPPSKPLDAVPPTLGRCGTPASTAWSSSSPTGMSWWWLNLWWSSKSCCRCSRPSTARSSSTWPSSLTTSSILWLIGEYCEHVPKIAPDVLRKMAKSFTNEEDIVKLQVINLAAKLYLTNSKQSKLLTQYVLNLAKYDQNYDIRDRARFIRQLIVPTEKSGALNKYAKKLFLAQKPAPILESSFKDRDHFQLGSLSHLLNAKAVGYQELPDWPDEAPDPSVRNVEVPEWTKCTSREKRKEKVEKPFYSDSEGESGPTESADSEPESGSEENGSSSSSGSSSSGTEEEDEEEEEEDSGEQSEDKEEEEEEEEEEKRPKRKDKEGSHKAVLRTAGSPSEEEEEEGAKKSKKKALQGRKGRAETSSEASTSESSSSGSDSGSEAEAKQRKAPPSSKASSKEISLLDLDDFTPPPPQPIPSSSIISTSLVTDLEGLTLTDTSLTPTLLSPAFSAVKTYELLHRMAGEGLAVEYCFSRRPFPSDPHMVAVQIQISNNTDTEVKNLRVNEPKPLSGMRIQEFPEIEHLAPGDTATVVMGIDFCDSTQAANFQLCTHTRQFYVSIQPPVGELMAPVFMSENEFKKEQGKLMGMSEITEKLTLPEKCRSDHTIVQQVTSAANVGRVPCGASNEYRFAAKTVTSGSLVLITLERREGSSAQLTINSEKMVIGTMLVKDIIQALTQ
ncbi:AP-3 complex subunit beta-2 isoform X4 [Serinus canaria]|uniref:AP-3 complex subunit beta-2 isoform X4 n=1 Tax=Serinus canaria TaxID=9135 RepID=UPI0021CCF857|nr:AP-3 complex subunit beta-2 isoform X4 [Serinus canaria]